MQTLTYPSSIKNKYSASESTFILSKFSTSGEGCFDYCKSNLNMPFGKLNLLSFFSAFCGDTAVLALKIGKTSALVLTEENGDDDNARSVYTKVGFSKDWPVVPWAFEVFLGERPTLLEQPLPLEVHSRYQYPVADLAVKAVANCEVKSAVYFPMLIDARGEPLDFRCARFKNIPRLVVFSVPAVDKDVFYIKTGKSSALRLDASTTYKVSFSKKQRVGLPGARFHLNEASVEIAADPGHIAIPPSRKPPISNDNPEQPAGAAGEATSASWQHVANAFESIRLAEQELADKAARKASKPKAKKS